MLITIMEHVWKEFRQLNYNIPDSNRHSLLAHLEGKQRATYNLYLMPLQSQCISLNRLTINCTQSKTARKIRNEIDKFSRKIHMFSQITVFIYEAIPELRVFGW